LAGCGFFLSLPDGTVIAATTAHSVAHAATSLTLDRIALGVAGHSELVAEFDSLVGPPGRPLKPDDLTMDYLLLQVKEPISPELVLVPDPRGAPQPGERVSLFSGLADPRHGPRAREGTVLTVSEKAVWVLMDDRFDPRLMSGSPFLSQHTAQLVGMAVAASPRGTRLLLGMHPIASLLQIAGSASGFPSLEEIESVSD
jgi:hypothetical protein